MIVDPLDPVCVCVAVLVRIAEYAGPSGVVVAYVPALGLRLRFGLRFGVARVGTFVVAPGTYRLVCMSAFVHVPSCAGEVNGVPVHVPALRYVRPVYALQRARPRMARMVSV